MIFVVHKSGNITPLKDVSEEQVADFVDNYPSINVFIQEDE